MSVASNTHTHAVPRELFQLQHTPRAQTLTLPPLRMGVFKRKVGDEGDAAGGRPSKRSSLDLAAADRPTQTIAVGPWSLSLRQRHW